MVSHEKKGLLTPMKKAPVPNQFALEAELGNQRFVATPEIVTRSNAILKSINSPIVLEIGEQFPSLKGMNIITPKSRLGSPSLFTSSECNIVSDTVTASGQTHSIFQDQGQTSKALVQLSPFSTALVNRIAELLVKGKVSPQQVAQDLKNMRDPDENGPRYSFRYQEVNVTASLPTAVSEALKSKIANINLRRALVRALSMVDYMPLAQQHLIDSVSAPLGQLSLLSSEEKNDEEYEKWQTWLEEQQRQARLRWSSAYASLAHEIWESQSASLGVNHYARPDVGEAYAIISSRERENTETTWSFHFAAVILRDGDFTMTLENYNREGISGGNAMWYCDIQGPDIQSFHEKHKATVSAAITLRMGMAADEDMKELFLHQVGGQRAQQVAQAMTRAELAAIYAASVV
jgi:hypothetical protein